MKVVALILGLLVVVTVMLPSPVMAMDEPDSVALEDIMIFQDLIVTDDFLAIVPYEIPFTAAPDDNIDDTFIFSMISSNGTTLGSTTAYPYNESGYGSGIVSFYFESGTIWEEDYIFRVQENPAHYPGAVYWDFTVGPSNYSDATDQSLGLRNKVLSVSSYLSVEYDEDLTTTSEGISYLSTYGEEYFLYSIPALNVMCPTLFYTQVRSPSFSKRSWTYTFSDALQTRYSGTFIGTFMTGSAGLFALDTPSFMNVISIMLFVILILFAVWKFKATTMSAVMDGYALLILLMLDGFFSMILCGFIAFVGIVTGGVVLFLNRS